ncbi:unnamed protein product [Caenorhabditis bovis]|uniref:Helitron helicase-like domain-containing protein n=1 Tax=Caenorhabditis bovis TaxID=2654633 RepID=A0A8S1E557_9PELO|nr:unnamed protein product [Caenorhabditis bovis]
MVKYVRSRLLNRNRTMAKNVKYMFFMYGLRKQRDLTSIMGTRARIEKGTKGRAVMDQLGDDAFCVNMSTVFAKLHGFAPYWNQCRLRIMGYLAFFGPPTWFVTLNPNEKNWPELHAVYSKITGKKVTAKNINEFSHYFYRVEYQHRGTQHVHCLFWTKERPSENAPPSEITEFLDKTLTARMPTHEEKELKSLDLPSRNTLSRQADFSLSFWLPKTSARRKAFLAAMEEQETEVCDVCEQLTDNNVHYRDIEINEAFKFEVGRDVFFEKPEATQKDADPLIDVEGKDDDDHLLTQVHIENVPMAEMNPPDALPGLASDHYKQFGFKAILKEGTAIRRRRRGTIQEGEGEKLFVGWLRMLKKIDKKEKEMKIVESIEKVLVNPTIEDIIKVVNVTAKKEDFFLCPKAKPEECSVQNPSKCKMVLKVIEGGVYYEDYSHSSYVATTGLKRDKYVPFDVDQSHADEIGLIRFSEKRSNVDRVVEPTRKKLSGSSSGIFKNYRKDGERRKPDAD